MQHAEQESRAARARIRQAIDPDLAPAGPAVQETVARCRSGASSSMALRIRAALKNPDFACGSPISHPAIILADYHLA
jgi:hypothetical protein